jgi:DNA-nicking Smr family endonuclease
MTRKPQPIAVAATSRRRRVLSAEERALWEDVARTTRPLKRIRKRHVPDDAHAEPTSAPVPAPSSAAPPAAPSKPAPKRLPVEPPPLSGLGRRERSQLARGRKEIEARLDLHGMTQMRAHRALLSFVERASDDGLSFVLVITGKGGGTGAERGVLRRQVPEWLGLPEFRACVVGFEEAHIGHGGAGALYVRIRRRGRR